MKILTLTNCPLDPTLGSGKTVIRYSEGLKSLGHEVDVLPPERYELAPESKRAKRFRQAFGAWKSVRLRTRVERYDIIECYGGEFWLVMLNLSKRSDRPLLIAHTNGLELLHAERERVYARQTLSAGGRLRNELTQMIHGHLMELSFDRADAFVSLCETDRRYVVDKGFFAEPETAVVAPGLDAEYLAMPKPDPAAREKRIAFVGSWTPRKGIDIVARTVSALLHEVADYTFDIYGAHAYKERVLASFDLSIRDRVVVHDELSNTQLAEGLSRAAIFFFPTQYEGYGMALAEAMACGCAAVTTPTGFGADLIDGREALICDFEDVPAMKVALKRLVDDPSLRAEIAANGWLRVRSLSWADNIARLETVYKGWLADRRPLLTQDLK